MNIYIIVPIVAMFVVAQTIAYKKECKLTDTLGLTCCGFILVLYILAFFGILTWIDYLSVPLLIAVIIWLISNEELKICFQKFITIQNVIVVLFLAGLVVSQYFRVVTWPEDISFWNTDLKQLWYLDGFAGKYANVVPDFGDYPPGVNLFKWFFVHMYHAKYIEGLGLAGYTVLNFVLLLPLTSRINELVEKKVVIKKERRSRIRVSTNKKYVVSDKRLISKYKVDYTEGSTGEEEKFDHVGGMILILINIFTYICILLLPTVVNKICFEGTSADVTMGIVFGMLLWSIWDTKVEEGRFYYVRIAIYGSVIILCKTIGIAWALLAFIFLIGCYISRRSNLAFDSAAQESKFKYLVGIIICWCATLASWIVYCVYNHRISKVTSDALALIGSKDLDIHFFMKANSFPFLQGFTVYPMHTNTSGILDLSVLMIFVVFIGTIVAYGKQFIITKSQCVWLLIYVVFTAIVAYGIIFAGHLTIFAGDSRYATGQGMALSLSNFSAPFVLGFFILICGIWFDTIPEMKVVRPTTESAVKGHIQAERLLALRIFYGAIAGFVLLCCDYVVVFNSLGGYWFNRDRVIDERDAYISNDSRIFLSEIKTKKELRGSRVLYLRDVSKGDDGAEAYISYEAAPISVVYGTMGEGANPYELWEYISRTHANYVYADSSEVLNAFFDKVCKDGHQSTGLYRIVDGDKIEAYHATLELDYMQGEIQ